MKPEQQPDHILQPPKEVSEEMSLGSVLRRLVDDLFTYQTVAEKIQGLNAGDALPALVETWKQGLTQHLEETVYQSVENVVALLDLLQSGESTHLTALERQEWSRVATWYKPYNVASLCREDLREVLPQEAIANLTDQQMQQIADRMADAYADGGYWNNLFDATEQVTNPKQDSPPPSPIPDTPQA